MRLAKIALVGLFVLAACRVQAQNLVTNGSFETGDLTGWTQSNLNNTFVTGPFYIWNPEQGNFFLTMGNVGSDGVISQTIATNIGDTYQVSYYFGSDGELPNDFTADFAGDTLYSQSSIPAQPYTFYSFDVTAGSTSSLLSFTERDDPAYLALDNIIVTDLSTSTPEPGSLAMLFGMGVCGTAAVVRRKRAKA